MIVLWTVLMVVGLGGSAMCSGLETGTYTANRVRLAYRARKGHKSAIRVNRELGMPERLLASLLIGNNAFNYIGILGVTGLLQGVGLSEFGVVLVQTAVLTPVLVVLAEAFPKEYVRLHADRVIERLSFVLLGLRLVASLTLVLPLVNIATKLARKSAAGSGFGDPTHARLIGMVREGASQLSGAQASLVDKALGFTKLVVGDRMIPLSEVATIRADQGRAAAMQLLHNTKAKGVLVRDAEGSWLGVATHAGFAESGDAGDWTQSLRPLPRVPMALSAPDGLRLLRREDTPFAGVETSGKIVGVVVADDLADLLLGFGI